MNAHRREPQVEQDRAGLLYIGGQWVEGVGEPFASIEPTQGDEVWAGPAAGKADLDRAMDAAFESADAWADAPFAEREAVVRRFGAQLEAHGEALATTISRETGKPRWESRAEVGLMRAKIDHAVRAWHARTGTQETQAGATTQRVWHKPHGVVAVFGPFNFPGHLPNGHLVPALLAGNSVLFKPSEQTPLVAEHMVKLWQAAGIPGGVLQLLQGGRDTGELIAAHPELDGLYFTGSARTGELLARQFASTPGRILALEMGGNNPLVVGSRPGDLRAAVHAILMSAFLGSGQRCTCARRLYVPATRAGDELIALLVDAAGKLRVGAWDSEPEPFMGPLISVKAADGILSAQTRLMALGARPLLETRRAKLGRAFLTPGVLDCSDLNRMPDEEHFGPLLCLVRYRDFGDAVIAANDTRFGLAAGLISEDEAEWTHFRLRIRAGVINRNRPTTGASGAAPFGGIGASGNHRASAFYAADYCAYPVATMESQRCEMPDNPATGMDR